MKKELKIPSVIDGSKEAAEIVRIWIADGKPTYIVSGNLFKDTAAWGLMLCDLAIHISKSLGENGADEVASLKRIKQAFDAEWVNQTK